MARHLIVYIILIFWTCSAYAQEYDFDNLNAGDGNHSVRTEKVTGAADASKNSLKRQKNQWEIEEEAEKRAAQAASERYRIERALGNGNRYYDCEYSCRTSGILADSTGKFNQRVKANEGFEAEQVVKKDAEEHCGKFKGQPGLFGRETMWYTGLRCEEVR